MGRKRLAATAGLLPVLAAAPAHAQYGYGYAPDITSVQIATYVVAAIAGLIIGALLSPQLRPYRRYLGMALCALLLFLSFTVPFPINIVVTVFTALLVMSFAIDITIGWGATAGGPSATFGSAKWARRKTLEQRDRIGEAGFALGYFMADDQPPLHYTGDRHLLTVAPTRSGKGVSSIIPNLLTYPGSALVIDPKGENAIITALRRGPGDTGRSIRGMGQNVRIVDPWGLTTELTGIQPACFNPLDWLNPASPDVGENAMMLADALVMPSGGGRDPFWDEEAKALLMGFILWVATSPEIDPLDRHLGRVRDLLMLPHQDFLDLCNRMALSDQPIVASTGARTVAKEPRLLSSVLSAAQSHTHFLDSPSLRQSLSWSDFQFEQLKREPTTIYLVLPADRLNTFGRWLRLLVQQAITVTARDIANRPDKPILFLLDEMPALGRLAMVEQAYGLMAGFGMQLWGIVQDLAQLKRIYDDGFETFIGNSGVLQYFGSRDRMTAEYFSALCGDATVPTLATTITQVFAKESSSSEAKNYGEAQRKLVMPDELMRLGSTVQIVLIENEDPIAGYKISWFTDERFRQHGVNLRPVAPSPEPGFVGAPPFRLPVDLPSETVQAVQQAIPDYRAAKAFLRAKSYKVRPDGWGTRIEVLTPTRGMRTVPNQAALLSWARGQYAREHL